MKKIINKEKICYIAIFAVVILFVLVGVNSSPLNNAVIQNDSAVFQIMGRGLTKGQIIYKDLFDHKGPIVYIINAMAYIINPKIGLFIIETLINYVGAIFIFKTARIFVGRKVSGTLTVTYFAMIFLFASGGNFTEEYSMTFTSIAMYCIIRILYKNEYENKWLWISIGVTFAINFFIKPTYIGIWIAFGIIQLIYSVKEKKIKKLIKYIWYMTIGIFVVTVPIIVYLIANNDINDFINAYFVLNMKYANSTIKEKVEKFVLLTIQSKSILLIIFSFICNIVIIANKKLNIKNKAFITLFYVITLILTAWAPNLYRHYLIQLATVNILELLGMCLYIKENLILKDYEKEILKDIPQNLVFSFIIIAILIPTLYNIACDGGICSKEAKYYKEYYAKLEELKPYLSEDDEIIVLGNDSYYYIYLNKYPKFKYFFQYPIIKSDSEIKRETEMYVLNEKPKMIIMNNDDSRRYEKVYDDNFKEYIKNNYQKYDNHSYFKYYVLKEKN